MPPPPPPPHPQPPPAPETAPAPAATRVTHPDLMVPPDAPYARYIVEDLLYQPDKKGLGIIDLDRPPNTYW